MLYQKILKSLQTTSKKKTYLKVMNPWSVHLVLRLDHKHKTIALLSSSSSSKEFFNVLLEKPLIVENQLRIALSEKELKNIFYDLLVSHKKLQKNEVKFLTLFHENGLLQ